MATKVTRYVAISELIAFAEKHEYDNKEVLDTAKAMQDKLKPVSKAGSTTTTAKSNDKFFDKHINVFDNDAILTAREYANAINGFPCDNTGRPSINKATAILVRAVNEGKLVRVPSEKKSAPMRYKLA